MVVSNSGGLRMAEKEGITLTKSKLVILILIILPVGIEQVSVTPSDFAGTLRRDAIPIPA